MHDLTYVSFLQHFERILISPVIPDVDGHHIRLRLEAQHLQQVVQRGAFVPIDLHTWCAQMDRKRDKLRNGQVIRRTERSRQVKSVGCGPGGAR